MVKEQLILEILALSKVKGIGIRTLNGLILNQQVQKVCQSSKRDLFKRWKDPNIVNDILSKSTWKEAEEELDLIGREGISFMHIGEGSYPDMLKHCYDAPSYFFHKGSIGNLDRPIISIVGTRKPDTMAVDLIKGLVEDISHLDPIIVSGLAIGVDTLAHQVSLEFNLKTIGVLGSGFNNFYPKRNLKLSRNILESGGIIISEYFLNTPPDKENFPKRNRIVAGLSDCTVVVQSAIKGGSLLTADLAFGYQRDVFAFPGDVGNKVYKGTHKLIKEHKAALIESGDDLIEAMSWGELRENQKVQQIDLFSQLSTSEMKVVDVLKLKGKLNMDDLNIESKLDYSELNTLLLTMELKGIIKLLPGKIYSL